jgi:hypothetical protein
VSQLGIVSTGATTELAKVSENPPKASGEVLMIRRCM